MTNWILDYWDAIQNRTVNVGQWVRKAYKMIVDGLIEGMNNSAKLLDLASRAAARDALRAMRDELQISSPSKKAMWIGEMFGQGLAEGIDGERDRVARAADSLAGAAETDLGARAAAFAGGAGSAGGFMIDYDLLAEAVARGNADAGLGSATIALDKRVVGGTLEPYTSRAGYIRGQKTVRGRMARMTI